MRLRLTCQEVTRKVLLRQEQPWAWHEQVVLRLHWMACEGCRRFRRQAGTVDQALRAWRSYREGDDGGA